MLLDDVTVLLGDLSLQFLDPVVDELDHVTRLQTDHMIVMRTVTELEDGGSALEVVPHDEARTLELGQNAVDGRKAEFLTRIKQSLVDGLCTQMSL